MKTTTLEPIVSAIGAADYPGALLAIERALDGETGTDWLRYLSRLHAMLNDAQHGRPYEPGFTILAKGNSKLPFVSFSVLPGVTCPGAGDCLEYCYSYKAWRYPAAFCRQVQNTLLMQSGYGRQLILDALDRSLATWKKRAKPNTKLDFRLYVDGDFASVQDVHFWFSTLRQRPDLAAYGYSKSFHELAGYAAAVGDDSLPANYKLNISGGHRHSAGMVAAMEALPITRGHFIATPTGDHKAYRAETGRKAFPCPGKCGECRTVKGLNVHACGDARMANVDVIIAVH